MIQYNTSSIFQIHVELCGVLDNYIPKTDNIPDLAEFFLKQLKSGSVKYIIPTF